MRERPRLMRRGLHLLAGSGAYLLPLLGWQVMAVLAAVALPVNLWLLPRLPGLGKGPRAGRRGLVCYPFSLLLLLLLFREDLAPVQAAWLALAVGDGLSPLLGRLWPYPRWPWNKEKSLSASGLSYLLAGAAMLPLMTFPAALGGASLGALGESFQAPMEDNLSVPLLAALGAWLAGGGW